MNKLQVMEALFSADCNIPSDVIAYIGANLNDANTEVKRFDHEAETVWQACGIEESDAKELTNTLNKYMNSLPSGERQKSKAIEYVLNSGNMKWLTIMTVVGLENITNTSSDKDDDLKELILKALMRKLGKDEE